MKLLILIAALAVVANNQEIEQTSNVLCYYDSRSYFRESQARMLPLNLEPALSFCTHLIYGYAGIQPDTFKMIPLNASLDVDSAHANYHAITGLKAKYPQLKVLLSVGGDADDDKSRKYNLVLESQQARNVFVSSAVLLVEQHGFDGIDLAWQFARIKPEQIPSLFWIEKEAEHREGFTALVRDMKTALNFKPGKQLIITLLPKVNVTTYLDIPAVIDLVDFVNIEAFDYYTPERNPKEADYAAPIYTPENRNPLLNIEAAITYWVLSHAPSKKLIIGISTKGRTWKLDADSGDTGVPPVHANQAGEAGPTTKIEGILSFPEVCSKLIALAPRKRMQPHLTKVSDPSKRYGTYAFRLPGDDGKAGLWVSYEDPDTASQKAAYVRSKNLGGVSIVDLSMDDFRGVCSGDKYPILRAVKYRL